MTQIRGIKRGLSDIVVDIEETTDHSSFFNVFGWRQEYNRGFHTLTISGSSELKRGTYIRVELLDEGGRPIPINLPSSSNEYEENYLPSRRIAFEITDETLNGVATMTFVGTTKNGKTVRYKKTFAINKNVQTNALIERGIWDEDEYYEANNVVQFQGSSYVCILRHRASASITPTNTTYWRVFAEGGTGTTIGLTRTPILIPFSDDGVGLYGSNSSTRIFIREGVADVTDDWTITASLVTGGDAQFTLVDDVLTVTSITEDTESDIIITATKGTDTLELQLSVLTVSSATGADAKLVKLNTDGQIFRYNTNGDPNPTSQEINFEVIRQNFDISQETNWSITDGSGNAVPLTVLTSRDDYQATLPIANFAGYDKLTIRVSVGSGVNEIADKVSVYRLDEGSDGLTVILTNESHVVQTDENGNNGDYSGAETEVWVFIGGDRIDLNANVTFDYRPQNTNIIVDNILSDTGDGYLKIQDLNVNSGYVDIDVFIDGIKVFEKRFSISKSIAGIKGSDAKLVKLNADGQIFTYDANDNPTPPSQEITFDVIRQNILATENTTWTIVDGSGASVSNTILTDLTNDGATLTIGNFGTYEKLTITATVDGISDRISVYKLNEGSEGVTVVLTNESHVLQANSNGDVADYSGASTEIWVFIGTQRIDQNAEVTFTYTPQNADVVIDNALSDTGNGFLKISELNAESGYVDIDVLINSVKIFEKRFSLIKSIAGADGQNGRTVDLSTDKQVFIYNSSGDLKGSGATTLIANANNTDGTVYYEFIVDGVSVQNTTSNTYSYTAQPLYVNMPQVVKVNIREGGSATSIVALDLMTLYGVKEGGDSLYTALSNESHVLGIDEFDNINYNGSGTDIVVYEGANQLPYDDVAPYGNSTYRVVVGNENGILAGTPETLAGGFIRRYGNANTMTDTQASITFNIIVTTLTGTEITIERIQSFTQSSAGADAKVIKIVAESQIFEIDAEGNPVNSTIRLDAVRQNYDTNDLEWYLDDNATPSKTLSDFIVIDLNDFAVGAKKLKVRVQNGDNTLFDIISLFIVRDGTQGVTIIAENENHTFGASSDGEVLSYDGSSTTIEVYYGAERLTFNNSASSFVEANDSEWFIQDTSIAPLGSIVATPTVSGQNAVITPSSFGDSFDSSTVSLTIGIKKGNDQRVFKKVLSYSKSKAGINAKLINIEYDAQNFKKAIDGSFSPNEINLVASLQNITGTVTWTNKDTGTVLDAGVNDKTLTISPSDFGINSALTVQAEVDGFIGLTTLSILADGEDAYTGSLSRSIINIPTDKDGNGFAGSYTNANSTLTIFKGTEDITSQYTIVADASTTLAGADYTLTGDTVTVTNMATDSEIFVFRATATGLPTIVKTFALAKSRRGETGDATQISGFVQIFRGNFDSGVTYERTDITVDVVQYGGTFYQVSQSVSSTVGNVPPHTSWEEIPTYKAIASDLALFEDVTIRRSLTMGEQGDFGNVEGGIIRSLGGFDINGNETLVQNDIDRRYYQLTKDGLNVHKGLIGGFEINQYLLKSVNNNIRLHSDGSGHLANTNISWLANGDSTFKGEVEIQGNSTLLGKLTIGEASGSSVIIDPSATTGDIGAVTPLDDYLFSTIQSTTSSDWLTTGTYSVLHPNKPYQVDLNFNNTNSHLVVATVRFEGKESNTSYYTLNEKSFELNANSTSSGKFIGNIGSVETIRVSVIFTSFESPSAGTSVNATFNQYNGSMLINNESIYIRISGDTVIPIDGFNSSGGSGGGGTSINLLFWDDIQGKLFESVGNNLNIDSNDVLDLANDISVTGNVSLGSQASTTAHAVRADRSISSGNGLTGGGNLTSNRTITLGTPSTISVGGSNGITASSHTHALNLSGRTITIANSDASNPVLSWNNNTQNLGGNRTWTPSIANHGNNQRGVVSTGTQTFYGQKTFNTDTVFNGKVSSTGATSGASGWQGTQNGDWDFRSITADSLIVKAFTADVAQAFRGSRFLTKSFATIAQDFTVPAVNSSASMTVNSIDGYADLDVFGDNDFILLTIVNQSDGGLVVGEAWGEVTNISTDGVNKTQTFIFTTRSVSETEIVGLIAHEGSEALSFGSASSPNGFIHDTVLDNIGSPYSQIVTWAYDSVSNTGPWDRSNWILRTRLGNLEGLPDLPNGTTPNGFGLYGQNVFLQGTIVAESGKIANWTIDTDTLSSGSLSLGNYDSGINITNGFNQSYTTYNGVNIQFDGLRINGDNYYGAFDSVDVASGTMFRVGNSSNFLEWFETGTTSTFKLQTDELSIINGSASFSGNLTATEGLIGNWAINENAICQNYKTGSFITLSSSRVDRSSTIGFSLYNQDDVVGGNDLRLIRIGEISNLNTTNTFSGAHYGVQVGYGWGQSYIDRFRIDDDGILLKPTVFELNTGGGFESANLFMDSEEGQLSVSTIFSVDLNNSRGRIGNWRFDTTRISVGISSNSLGIINGVSQYSFAYRDTVLSVPTDPAYGFYVNNRNYFIEQAGVVKFHIGKAIDNYIAWDSNTGIMETTGSIKLKGDGIITTLSNDYVLSNKGIELAPRESIFVTNNDRSINFNNQAGTSQTRMTLIDDTAEDVNYFLITTNVDFRLNINSTVNFIINGLPTTAPSVTAGRVYTRTASQLGGSGSTKVMCIT